MHYRLFGDPLHWSGFLALIQDLPVASLFNLLSSDLFSSLQGSALTMRPDIHLLHSEVGTARSMFFFGQGFRE